MCDPGVQDCSHDFPLLPSAVGTTVKKDKVVETIEALAHLTGLSAVDEQGRRAFGGHSLRVSGARWLGSTGVPIQQIKSLVRWSSAIVELYVGDAILNTLSSQVRRASVGSNPLSFVLHLFWLRPMAQTWVHHTWTLMKKQALLRV